MNIVVPKLSARTLSKVLSKYREGLSRVLRFHHRVLYRVPQKPPKCSVQGSKKAQMRTENEKSIPIFLEQGLRVKQDH